ncbi:MAG: HAD family hydrolase [Bacteroidetes bacterium]|nr:HAD family hydrolase [Bacteroidota bacterium]
MDKILLFDWGNTIMVDFNLPGPMYSWGNVSWVKGAEESLKALSGYTCCIATNAGNSDSEAVKRGLARVGADRYFSYIFCSRDIGFVKPDLKFFRFVVDVLRREPADCIMIGDNYTKDIKGAKTTGMKTVLFNPGGHAGPFPLADSVITGMDQLPAIIEKL